MDTFKIAMCGPSRVGKTSIITALLQEAESIFAEAASTMELVPDERTGKLIARQVTSLQGDISVGEFNPGSLSGNQSSNEFVLDLQMKIKKKWWDDFEERIFGNSRTKSYFNKSIRWAILDYPGAWLEGESPPKDQWQKCQDWVRESRVLIVPVDAAVLMETKMPIHKKARFSILRLYQAEILTRQWAMGRCEKKENGMLILAPLKCESYFSDNGGVVDKSKYLENITKHFYQKLVDTAKKQCQNVSISFQYHPVDTIGCVEIKDSEWVTKNREGEVGQEVKPENLEFKADYIVREGQGYRPLGAADLLLEICKEVISSRSGKGVAKWPAIGGYLDSVPQLKKEIERVVEFRDKQLGTSKRIKTI
jgi:GTPase SAR1 family protein